MNISLVTGGGGFIGAHVGRELLELGHQVVILDDLSGGFKNNIPDQAIFVQGSINDHSFLSELFIQYQFDYIYHFAAYAAEGLSHFIKRFNYENNLIGSVNLINEAVKHKIKCFVFTSSIAVYGSIKPPMKEEAIPHPEDPYGIAKLAVEQELKVTHDMFGLNYVTFRPHNVYGEYQNLGDKYRNVVGIFMNQILQNKPLTIFGDGSQTRAFSYIGDIAPLMANSVNIPKAYQQIINIGADQQYSIIQLAEAVMKVLNYHGKIRYLEARKEVTHAYADHSKANHVFGKIPKTSLADGLEKMADWAIKTGVSKSQRFGNIEIMEKLPPFWVED